MTLAPKSPENRQPRASATRQNYAKARTLHRRLHRRLHQRLHQPSRQRPDDQPERDHAQQREVAVAPHDQLQIQNQSKTGPMPRAAPAITQAINSRRSSMFIPQKETLHQSLVQGQNGVSAPTVESCHPTTLSWRQCCGVAPVLSGAVLSGSSNLRPTLSGR